MKRLESQVFRAMQLPDSALYEPGLAALLKVKKTTGSKAKARLCNFVRSCFDFPLETVLNARLQRRQKQRQKEAQEMMTMRMRMMSNRMTMNAQETKRRNRRKMRI